MNKATLVATVLTLFKHSVNKLTEINLTLFSAFLRLQYYLCYGPKTVVKFSTVFRSLQKLSTIKF